MFIKCLLCARLWLSAFVPEATLCANYSIAPFTLEGMADVWLSSGLTQVCLSLLPAGQPQWPGWTFKYMPFFFFFKILFIHLRERESLRGGRDRGRRRSRLPTEHGAQCGT